MKNSIVYATSIWKITLTESQRKKVNYFSFVSVLRSQSHHRILETDN